MATHLGNVGFNLVPRRLLLRYRALFEIVLRLDLDKLLRVLLDGVVELLEPPAVLAPLLGDLVQLLADFDQPLLEILSELDES